MPIEIERKFLVDTIPSQQINRSKKVKQGYLVYDERQVVRGRSLDGDHFQLYILIYLNLHLS